MIDDIVTKEFFDWYFDPATGEIEVKSSKVLYRSATQRSNSNLTSAINEDAH